MFFTRVSAVLRVSWVWLTGQDARAQGSRGPGQEAPDIGWGALSHLLLMHAETPWTEGVPRVHRGFLGSVAMVMCP